MQYFKSLPKMYYSFDLANQSPKVVTNIFSRFKFKQNVLDNTLIYYKYQVKDGDTPEIVAYQQYGDPGFHWIICMINGLIDPKFDFPLLPDQLERKIVQEYGYTTIDEARAEIHHYELETVKTLSQIDGAISTTSNTTIVTLEQFDYTSNNLITNVTGVPVTTTVNFRANNADPNTAIVSTLTSTETYKPVYVYDYEYSLNENKREIKLIKKQYIEAIAGELQTILSN